MDINKYSPSYGTARKHITGLLNLSTEEIFEILYATKVIKSKFLAHENTAILKDTSIALMFADTSLRSRTAIEIGVRQLGGTVINLPYGGNNIPSGENIKDIVTIMSRYGVGAMVTRGINKTELDRICAYSDISIINSNNDKCMPLQALNDLFTIWEKKNRLEGLKIAIVGKCGSSASSLTAGAVMCGMEVAVASPEQYVFEKDISDGIRQYGSFTVTDNPVEAVRGADIVYTDSYPLEERDVLKAYQVNNSLMSFAAHNAIFMHPLPANRGVEVTPEIIDGKNSIILDQGENKLHTVKAVLALLIK